MRTMKQFSPRRSLSSRFVLGTFVMLMPLLAVAEGALLSMDRAFEKVQIVIHETAGEGILNLEAQTAILRANDAVDHYLQARTSRKVVSATLKEADAAFARLLGLDFDGKGEREKIEVAEREWVKARSFAEGLILRPVSRDDTVAARMEEGFEGHLRQASSTLRESVAAVNADLVEQQATANAARMAASRVIVCTAILGFLGALACAIALARSVLNPLAVLQAGTQRLGRGELAYRVNVRSQDELGILASSFNEMGTRLESGRDSLQAANLQLEESIAEARRMQQAQRASEERFRLAAENASDLIYEWDIAHDIMLWIGDIDSQLGYKPGTFPHTIEARETLIHHDDRDRIVASIQHHLQSGSAFFEEYRVCRKDGAILYWTDRATIIRDDEGKAVKWIGATSDITESKLAQAALAQSEMRLRALVESIDEVVFEFDGEGTYLNIWSDNEDLLARPKAELLGRRVMDVLDEEIGRPFLEIVQHVMSLGHALSMEYSIALPAGERWFLARISPIFSADGVCRTVCMLARDITDRKDAETSLKLMRDGLEVRVEERTSALALANRDLQSEIKERQDAEAETRARARQQEAVAELGRRALTDIDVDTLLMGATHLVTTTLEVEVCSVLELTPGKDSFHVRAGNRLQNRCRRPRHTEGHEVTGRLCPKVKLARHSA